MTLQSSLFKISTVLLLSLTGCVTIDIRGHEVEPAQLAAIKVGRTTKKQVAELLGTPSSVSTFDNQTWFYMYEETQRRAFLSPYVMKSNVTRIQFDKNERVLKLDSLTEKDYQVISHVHRETPTAGHTFGVIEQLLGNVGRFNGKDPDK